MLLELFFERTEQQDIVRLQHELRKYIKIVNCNRTIANKAGTNHTLNKIGNTTLYNQDP